MEQTKQTNSNLSPPEKVEFVNSIPLDFLKVVEKKR